MSYAIISVGGKQYRVREGERLLVDRLALEDGASFTPTVLLAGGTGEPSIAPGDVTVTAKVLAQAKGPKIRIGKYKQRTGYKRHTGFRASLTHIEIESIGGGKAKPKSDRAEQPEPAAAPEAPGGLPEGYADLTVAGVKESASRWDPASLAAALSRVGMRRTGIESNGYSPAAMLSRWTGGLWLPGAGQISFSLRVYSPTIRRAGGGWKRTRPRSSATRTACSSRSTASSATGCPRARFRRR